MRSLGGRVKNIQSQAAIKKAKESLVIHSSQIMLTRKGMILIVASIVLEKDQAEESMSLYGGLVDDGIELDDNTSYEHT